MSGGSGTTLMFCVVCPPPGHRLANLLVSADLIPIEYTFIIFTVGSAGKVHMLEALACPPLLGQLTIAVGDDPDRAAVAFGGLMPLSSTSAKKRRLN